MDFVKNLGAKDKKSFEENGYSLIESDSAGFHVQISSQNHEAVLTHQTGEASPR